MATKQVVQIQCDRCERVETHAADAKPVCTSVRVDLGKELGILFDDLCGPCYRAVAGHVEAIGKKIKGLSPDRVAKEKKPAAPSPPPLTARPNK